MVYSLKLCIICMEPLFIRIHNAAFKTAGQIAQINVKEGEYVREGQLIASLDDADYKLGVEALQIQHDQVSDEVSRVRELYKKNIL